MIIELKVLEGTTNLKFHQIINDYYEHMICTWQSKTIQFEEDPFAKIIKGIAKIMHEALLSMKSF